MSDHRTDENGLDYERVREYWERAATEPDAASYMAHEQGLPAACVTHRFGLECEVVDRWFAELGPAAAVLDVGCGAGAWTEHFARRFGRVVGIDGSPGMVAAASRRLAGCGSAELIEGDALTVPIDGEFDGVLVGGLLMYLDRADAVSLLTRLGRLAPQGRIILRESGVRTGVEVRSGNYPVAYRSVGEYEALIDEAGLRMVTVERNRGYAHMEVAVALVDLARRLPALRRRDPGVVGRPLWRALAATAPVSLELVPRALRRAHVDWPHLSNNFFLVEPV
ncbi:MAG: methyltransferase domain-containing protein [Jatrophihabitans sp.]